MKPVEAKGRFTIAGQPGEGTIRVKAEAIELGGELVLPWLDVDAVLPAPQKLVLKLPGSDVIELSMLGAMADAVARESIAAWDDAAVRGMMLDDGAETARPFEGKIDGKDDVRIRAFERGVAILGSGAPFAVPFGNLEAITWNGDAHALSLASLTLTHLGSRADELTRTLQSAFERHRASLAGRVGGWLSDLGPLSVRKVAQLLRDGRIAKKSALDAVAPGTFDKLATRAPLPERAPRLKELLGTAAGEPWVGVKATADAERPVLFFVVPVGDALAFEVASEADHATYRFAGCSAEELAAAMVAARFRREPIFQPADEAARGEWRMALRLGSALPSLRSWFQAREAHA